MPTKKLTACVSLEQMIAASPALQSPQAVAVVTLARMLAVQVDAAPDGPSTRLAASYLSILKDLRRLTAEGTHARPAGRLALIKANATAAKSGAAS